MGREKLVGGRSLTCLHKAHFPFHSLAKLTGVKISVSYTRLMRKVPFGTGGFTAGSRNLASLPSNTLGPRLS
jgi:hypothetical protein